MRRSARRFATLISSASIVLSGLGAGALPVTAAGTTPQASTHSPVSAGHLIRPVSTTTVKGTHVDGRSTPQTVPHRHDLKLGPGRTLPSQPAHKLTVDMAESTSSKLAAPGPDFTVRQSVGFNGISDIDQISALGCSGQPLPCVEPPDPWVGVGPDHVVQAVNLRIRITDRTGVPSQADQGFPAFFVEPANQVVDSDPRVIYDADHGVWLATAVSFDCTAGHLYLGITSGADPTDPTLGNWTMFRIDLPGAIPDYPGLGWSNDKIVLTYNQFAITACDGGDYQGAGIQVVDFADATDGAPITASAFTPNVDRFAWRPAQGVTDAAAYLVGVDLNNGHVRYAPITGTVGGADLAMTDTDVTDFDPVAGTGPVFPFSFPDAPIQRNGAGTTDTIDVAVDFRPTDAVWRDDRLWFVATAGCDDGLRSIDCVQLTELDTSNAGAGIQSLFLGATNSDYFMGGIGFGSNPSDLTDAALHVVFSGVTPTGYVATYAAYRFESDDPETIRFWHLIKAGVGRYDGERWGDYVGVATDPSDPTSVWQADEYPNTSHTWNTWVSKLTVSTVDIAAGVTREFGADRFATAVDVSAHAFAPGVAVAYVATGTNFPDALAGGPAAALEHGPLLLVQRDSIPGAVQAELTRLQPKRIVVLGGTGAISAAVVTALDPFTSGTVTRLSGSDRFATAAAVSSAVFPRGVFAVFLATGANFPDALSGGPVAGLQDGPLLLVSKTTVPASTATELSRLRPAYIFILGGTGVISDTVKAAVKQYTSSNLASRVIRLAGADRYSTATRITSSFFAPGIDVVYVGVGTNFPDALAGGPAAALEDGALLLVTKDTIPATTATELNRLDPKRIVVLGGSAVISDTVKNALAGFIVP